MPTPALASNSQLGASNPVTKRMSGIEMGRVLAAFAVVTIHTHPFLVCEGGIGKMLNVLVNQAARFAVPYFFIMAGFFWARRAATGVSTDGAAVRYGARLLRLFLVWSALYFALSVIVSTLTAGNVPDGLAAAFKQLTTAPLKSALEGAAIHLWFFPALGCAFAITALMTRAGLARWTLPVAVVLFVIGLAGGGYQSTALGVDLGLDTRNGPFFGTLFFVIGVKLYQREGTKRWQAAVFMLIVGFLVQTAESLFVYYMTKVSPSSHDYMLGTVLFGWGAAELALAKPNAGTQSMIVKLGEYTLGIYLVHLAILEPFKPLLDSNLALNWAITLGVFAVSALVARWFHRQPFLRRVLT